MKIALYVGNHAGDTWSTRLGWWITRVTQKGPFGNVTHCEAIHAEHEDGSVTIASSSLRDGGVRSKRVTLDLKNWIVVDIPQWDVQRSIDLLAKTQGQGYDWRGALATRLPGSPDGERWFCNEWVAFPYLQAAATFSPNHLAAICMSIRAVGVV